MLFRALTVATIALATTAPVVAQEEQSKREGYMQRHRFLRSVEESAVVYCRKRNQGMKDEEAIREAQDRFVNELSDRSDLTISDISIGLNESEKFRDDYYSEFSDLTLLKCPDAYIEGELNK